jgi:hypothetical protein
VTAHAVLQPEIVVVACYKPEVRYGARYPC